MDVGLTKGQDLKVVLREGHEEVGRLIIEWDDDSLKVRAERIDEARTGPLVVTAP